MASWESGWGSGDRAPPSGTRDQAGRMVADAIILERASRVLERYGWQGADTCSLLASLAGKLRREADREHR